MGFYIRKGISFGPFRLNLSKSGLGLSVGVKGARVSTGPRGTYVHMGRYGLYYRQRIDGPGARSGFQDIVPSEVDQEHSGSPFEPRVNETADVSRLVDSSSEELLSQINARAHQTAYAPLLAAGSIILSLVELAALEATPTAQLIAGAILAIGLACTWRVHQRDTLKRTTPLFYELDERAAHRFAAVQGAVLALGRSERVWRVESEQVTWDRKRNAGAASLLKRRQVAVGRMKPPFIATNIEVSSIDLGAERLFFLPDRLFVFRGGTYGAVHYDSFNVTFSLTQFVESQGVPTDARVLYHTWQYVNKDGGPDRRFSNNRQIPVVEYGLLTLKSATGLNVHLHVSNKSLALQFAEAFGNARGHTTHEGPRRESTTEERGEERSPGRDARVKAACAILGVEIDASLDAITAAYRRMAQMYHPDKVANLAPEFRELAERRMKEINAAYEELRDRVK